MGLLGPSSSRPWRWRRSPVPSGRRPTACATSLSPNYGTGRSTRRATISEQPSHPPLGSAGQFLGQAEILVEDLNLNLESYAEAARAVLEADLRSRLGEDRLEALRAEGRSLSIEAAVSEALAALD